MGIIPGTSGQGNGRQARPDPAATAVRARSGNCGGLWSAPSGMVSASRRAWRPKPAQAYPAITFAILSFGHTARRFPRRRPAELVRSFTRFRYSCSESPRAYSVRADHGVDRDGVIESGSLFARGRRFARYFWRICSG